MEKAKKLQMKQINKSFGEVQVLHDVDFGLDRGEVRALAGENGAGKSTLIKVLGGIYTCNSGEIWIDGEKLTQGSVEEAQKAGVAIIHQEIVLVQDMTVAENIFLGREFKTKAGFIDYPRMNASAAEMLGRIGLDDVSPDTIVRELSISRQQMVEIARALSMNAGILVMDEPTSSLTDREVEFLFEQIRSLKEKGTAIIYISHKMDEIFKIADSVTVMRDGCHVVTKPLLEISYEEIIQSMVGHKIEDYYPDYKAVPGKTLLEVRNLTTEKVQDITFSVAEGEIFGLIGLMGAGRTELANALFGIDHVQSGEIFIDGKKDLPKSTRQAIDRGIALVPEDRKTSGLFLENTIAFNMTITVMKEFIKGVFVDQKKEKSIFDEYIGQLEIKMADTEQLAGELSGGNQQKIVISKWLAAHPRILILDEPTRGVDVGAKSDIYHLICDIARQGVAIILISSELPEVMNMSTRIGVMCEGQMVKIFEPDKEKVTQEIIMHYATGGFKHETYNR
ncbi:MULTISPECIES: sugar ABC transporter ATP-binding protein [Eubacteriales]|uniref:sugar ABC transporter ATP-binding protein n=1 Tax=Eubacteriales TaxID=186802 RepID=UPI00051B3C80|nr:MULTISPECIES: sugar ABC transporter ATP-binding protein [Eubacteriales]